MPSPCPRHRPPVPRLASKSHTSSLVFVPFSRVALRSLPFFFLLTIPALCSLVMEAPTSGMRDILGDVDALRSALFAEAGDRADERVRVAEGRRLSMRVGRGEPASSNRQNPCSVGPAVFTRMTTDPSLVKDTRRNTPFIVKCCRMPTMRAPSLPKSSLNSYHQCRTNNKTPRLHC